MNKWLEAHVYIVEWIGNLCAIFAGGGAFLVSATYAGKRIAKRYLPTVKEFPTTCRMYIAIGLVAVWVRLPGNREAAKELTKYVLITVFVWALYEALKEPAPQQNWPDC